MAPSKDCIGGKAASEIFKISMRARVSQLVRWKENLATALKLYAHGLTLVTRMGGSFYTAHSSLNVEETSTNREHNSRRIQTLDCFVISASLIVFNNWREFRKTEVKMIIKRAWCIGIGWFDFYFYRKWCLIDWNQVYGEW